MSRIRFSDQVLSSEDVSSSAAMTNTSSRRQSFATSSSNGHNAGMLGTIGRGHSIQLSDLGGPASSAVGRSPSRRSLDNRGGGVGSGVGVMYRRGPASIAASDTSSAAGFRPSSRMMHHSTSVDYTSNHGFSSSNRRMGSLYRSNAIDDDVSPGNPRYSGQQEYVDEVDYRNGGGGGGNGVIGGVPTLDVASVTTSSPYSPRSGDSSGYNPNATTIPILKNGTLPRSRQNSTAYGTMERNRNGRLSVGGNCEPPVYANSDFGGTVPHRPPSRAATVNSACGGGGGGYGNGSTAGSVSSYGGGSGHHSRPNQLNGNLRRPGMPTRQQSQQHRNSSHITPNPLDDMMATASDFPTLPPRRSESTPVIATPHRPCCECNLISRVTGRDGDGTQQYPIAFLFSIFLIFSVVIVSGIMLYLRGGYGGSGLAISPSLPESPSSPSSSSSSSNGMSNQRGTALSTKRCDDGPCLAFGGVCVADDGGVSDGSSSSSRCQCPDPVSSCPPFDLYSPVCGSDGRTYESECKMRAEACRNRKAVTMKHAGECGAADPCRSLTCPKFSRCQPSFDGASAKCACPQHCTESENSEDSSVCGSDGRDYPSECYLEKAACERRQMDLVVRYRGKCNPCSSQRCPATKECHLQQSSTPDEFDFRQPTCDCDLDCSEDFAPVCASNGKTYRHECYMRLESCRLREPLHAVYSGNCSSGLNQCRLLSCSSHGETCRTTKQGISSCACADECEAVVRPVCASDGRTYDNECEMRRAACRHRKEQGEIYVKYIGTCDSNGPCTKRACAHHSVCVESDDLAFCECPTCPLYHAPVCGSDGVTYENECMLKRAACTQETHLLTVVEEGPCTGCANVTCELYALCQPSPGTTALSSLPSAPSLTPSAARHPRPAPSPVPPGSCVCPTTCSQISDLSSPESDHPVCGTDGRTYDSECHLRIEACRKQQHIVVANRGSCDLCKDVRCKHGARCEQGICVCPTNCPEERQPLCATDLNTYANECDMLKRSCELGDAGGISFLYHGVCEGDSIGGTDHDGTDASLCDSNDGRCHCLPGVSGARCDRCLSAYWGFNLIGVGGYRGCRPCDCSPHGSARSDCDQTTGACMCKPSITGHKCDTCPDGTKVTSTGCNGLYFPMGSEETPDSCGGKICQHGARCDAETQTCSCQLIDCPPETLVEAVCGSDGQSYASECQLIRQACEKEVHILIVAYNPCSQEDYNTRNSMYYYDPVYGDYDDDYSTYEVPETTPSSMSDLQKSTRHVPYVYDWPESPASFTSSPPSIVVFGLLGDECLADEECRVEGSACVRGRCSCDRDGDKPSPEGDKCLPSSQSGSPSSAGPCSTHPCYGGGTCEEHDGTFTCFCPSDRAGDRCELSLEKSGIEIPSFDDKAFVELKPLTKVEHKFSLDIEFRSLAQDGILLFAQQTIDGSGDFISLALKDSYVEFRYELGSGPALLRSSTQVSLGQWHRVQARRWHRDGMLKLGESDSVEGSSGGDLRSLDILGPTYVGAPPPEDELSDFTAFQKVLSNVNMSRPDAGFRGCIRNFKVNLREVKLSSASDPMVTQRSGLAKCGTSPCEGIPCKNNGKCHAATGGTYFSCSCPETYSGVRCEASDKSNSDNEVRSYEEEMQTHPCESSPCLGGGTCVAAAAAFANGAQFVCRCPPGRAGRLCQDMDNSISSQPTEQSREAEYDRTAAAVPAFGGSSYLELPTLRHVGRAFAIELWFLALKPDGILMYDGQESNGQGDFLYLALEAGRLVLRFDLGGGAVTAVAQGEVEMGRWHSAVIQREGTKGWVQLDDRPKSEIEASGGLTELNLETPLYLGGVKFTYTLSRDALGSGSSKSGRGLVGAIQRLTVNGDPMEGSELTDAALDSASITRYRGQPCQGHRCANGGICRPRLDSYVCSCPPGYYGHRCTKVMRGGDGKRAIRFDGNTHLSFMNKVNRYLTATTANQTNINNNEDDDGGNIFEEEDAALLGDHLEEGDDNDDDYDAAEELEENGRRGEKHNKFTLVFRTSHSDGLLVWSNQGATLHGDFLAIAIVDGYPELSFNLGKQQEYTKVVSKTRVDDGRWHKLRVLRKKRLGILQVDGYKPTRSSGARRGATVLNTDGKVWIGGKRSLPSGLNAAYYKGFRGCVRRVKLFRRKLDLLRGGGTDGLDFCDSDGRNS